MDLYKLKTRKNKSSHKNFKLKTKKVIHSLQKGGVNNMVASAGSDNIIRLWEGDNGQLLKQFTDNPHTGKINCIAFSSNNKYLASAGDDTKIFIWNTLTKTFEKELKGHLNKVNCVSWKPNSMILASGSDNGSVKLWDTLRGECFYIFDRVENYNVDCLSWGIKRINVISLVIGYNSIKPKKQISIKQKTLGELFQEKKLLDKEKLNEHHRIVQENSGQLKIFDVNDVTDEIQNSQYVIDGKLFEKKLFSQEKIQSIFYSDKLIILTNKYLRKLNFDSKSQILNIEKEFKCDDFKFMTCLDDNTVIISDGKKLLKIKLDVLTFEEITNTNMPSNIYSLTSFIYTSSKKILIGTDNKIFLYDNIKKSPFSVRFHIKEGYIKITSIAAQNNNHISSLKNDYSLSLNDALILKLKDKYVHLNEQSLKQSTISLGKPSQKQNSLLTKIEDRTKKMKMMKELDDYLKSKKLFFDNNFNGNQYRLQNYDKFKLNIKKFKLIFQEIKTRSPSTYSTSSSSNRSSSPSSSQLDFYNNNTGQIISPTISVPSPKASFTILNNSFNSLYSNTKTEGNLQQFIKHILDDLKTKEYSFLQYKSKSEFKNNFIKIMIYIYKEIILRDFINKSTKFKNKRYVYYLMLFKLLDFILVKYKEILNDLVSLEQVSEYINSIYIELGKTLNQQILENLNLKQKVISKQHETNSLKPGILPRTPPRTPSRTPPRTPSRILSSKSTSENLKFNNHLKFNGNNTLKNTCKEFKKILTRNHKNLNYIYCMFNDMKKYLLSTIKEIPDDIKEKISKISIETSLSLSKINDEIFNIFILFDNNGQGHGKRFINRYSSFLKSLEKNEKNLLIKKNIIYFINDLFKSILHKIRETHVYRKVPNLRRTPSRAS